MIIDDSAMLVTILLAAILYYNSLRNRHKLTRSAIVSPKLSPWQHLLVNGDNQSFLEMTGFSKSAFKKLEKVVFPPVDYVAPFGRPSSLDQRGELGLYLFYVNSTMKSKHLYIVFGIVPTTACTVINKMIKVIVEKLRKHPASRIRFPDQQQMAIYAQMVNNREPAINNVIGFVDGLSIPVQCSDDILQQNAAYNGYHHDTMCNNVMAFAPTGKIIFACLNYPGSWHDSQVCAPLIDIVVREIGQYAFCVDQGFPRSGDLFDKFVGPMSQKLAVI